MEDKIDPKMVVVESPGELLKAARENMNLSVEEIANQQNWLKSYVTAIEEDRYSAFSNQTFAKGYLRSYARRLGVEEKSLIDSYNKIVRSKRKSPPEIIETNTPTLHKNGIGKYVGLIVFLLVVLILWFSRSVDDLKKDDIVTETSESVARVFENETLLSLNQTETALDATGVIDSLQGEVQYQDTIVDQIELKEINKEVLYFVFTDQCWLEVVDASDDVIYQDLRQAGDRIEISGFPPFEILAGKASAVKLRYQGKAIPVKADSGRNSVRLKIGE